MTDQPAADPGKTAGQKAQQTPEETAQQLNEGMVGEFMTYCGLQFVAVSDDRVEATWKAGPPLHQPYGIVHGGAHCAVIETLASVGGMVWFATKEPTGKVVGVNNNTDFYKAVSDAHLANIIRVDLSSTEFNYDIDERALAHARMMDGKLLLVTNMPDHTPAEIVARYKALADIERGFRVLKSEIEIAPVYHRLPERIRAHALICFLALVLYRVLRMRLKASDQRLSPERALEIVRRIQHHQVTLHRNQTASVLTSLTPEQRNLFDAINLPEPSAKKL